MGIPSSVFVSFLFLVHSWIPLFVNTRLKFLEEEIKALQVVFAADVVITTDNLGGACLRLVIQHVVTALFTLQLSSRSGPSGSASFSATFDLEVLICTSSREEFDQQIHGWWQ